MTATLTDDHYTRTVVIGDDIVMCAADGYDLPYEPGEDVGPKFSSVAAMILWQWSLDSSQDETAGDAQYGNGWNALFRDERAILNASNSGYVCAWQVDEQTDLDEYWSGVEADAVYPDDDEVTEG